MHPLLWCSALLLSLMVPVAAHGQEVALFAGAPVSDGELASSRGGFQLPGGIEVALAATITTSVDGVRLLQTTLQIGATAAVARTTGATTIAIDPRDGTALATLPGLSVEHFVGQRLGSVILNTGDNRTIDNQVTLDLSLGNVPPLSIGSAMFRMEALGIDAGTWRATGG